MRGDLPGEVWLDVIGYVGFYQISNLGRIWSVPRLDCRRVPRGGHLLKTWVCKSTGYLKCSLRANGKFEPSCVHWIVAAAFLGPRPEGQEVCHEDGVRNHCELLNLHYGTRLENNHVKIAHGTMLYGEKNHATKLTEMKVRVIKARIKAGERGADIARDFSVTKELIYSIAKGNIWKQVTL